MPLLSKAAGLALLVLFYGCLPNQLSTSKDFLITGQSLGRVKLGMRGEDIKKLYPAYEVKEVDLLLEGMAAPAIEVLLNNAVVFVAELQDNGIVYRISTRDKRFKTPTGIGVGSTFGDTRSKYGSPEFSTEGEGGFYAAFNIEGGYISFSLDTQGKYSIVSPEDSMKIDSVLVVQIKATDDLSNARKSQKGVEQRLRLTQIAETKARELEFRPETLNLELKRTKHGFQADFSPKQTPGMMIYGGFLTLYIDSQDKIVHLEISP
jgi:hypothetical protein